jgi:hypothetical protein
VGHEYCPVEDGCLISLWDAWTRFLRRLVMVSASGPVVGLSGATYAPVVARTEIQVLNDLWANRKGKDFGIVNSEPKWNSGLLHEQVTGGHAA